MFSNQSRNNHLSDCFPIKVGIITTLCLTQVLSLAVTAGDSHLPGAPSWSLTESTKESKIPSYSALGQLGQWEKCAVLLKITRESGEALVTIE